MGGHIKIAIRTKDGKSFCVGTRTISLSSWVKHPDMFKDDSRAKEWLKEIDDHKDSMYGHPERICNGGCGIVVFDYMTNTIIDNNSYSEIDRFPAINAIDTNVYNPRKNEQPVRKNYQDLIDNEKIKSIVDIHGECLKSYPTKKDVEKQIKKDTQRLRRGFLKYFIIDTSPMTYINVGDCDAVGFKPVRKQLKLIGFPTNKKEGLNKYRIEDL